MRSPAGELGPPRRDDADRDVQAGDPIEPADVGSDNRVQGRAASGLVRRAVDCTRRPKGHADYMASAGVSPSSLFSPPQTAQIDTMKRTTKSALLGAFMASGVILSISLPGAFVAPARGAQPVPNSFEQEEPPRP